MKTVLFLGAVLLVPCCALGESRMPVYDFQLVECELVVVARIEPETFKQSPGKTDVKLIVAETLKGVAPGEIFDVRLRGFLVVGGYYQDKGRTVDLRGGRKDYPKTKIALHDGRWADKGAADLSNNAIWFLQKNKDGTGYVVKVSGYVQSVTLKLYFTALLSGERAKVLKLLSHKDQVIRMRVLNHLSGFHRPKDVRHVLPLLGDKIAIVQSFAARTLAQIADASAVGHFRKALGHKNPNVRAVAAIFLSRFRDVQSIPAIGRALRTPGSRQERQVLASLGRMGSRKAVPVLLEFLDERPVFASVLPPGRVNVPGSILATPPRSHSTNWKLSNVAYMVSISKAVATSLHELTGVRFPLDAPEARKRWERLKGFPHEVLIRKDILAEIENLTHENYNLRWRAYRCLGKLVNRHFGSYSAFHVEKEIALREKSQALWRKWASENLTRSRLDWIYDGFKASGIRIPRPMDKKGIDTLIEVLDYYVNWDKQAAAGRPRKWDITGGGSQADMHRHNANLLLERYTGHTVGLSPYHSDLRILFGQNPAVLEDRWGDWWRTHRDGIKLKPWPVAPRVTAEMLSKVPSPAPISVTIRTSKAAYTLREPLVVYVQVTNISSRAITIQKRLRDMSYTWTTATGGSTGSGWFTCTGGFGQSKEGFLTLKPGSTLGWDEAKANLIRSKKPASIQGFHYRLKYAYAGNQFGLRAWRGEVTSNRITYELTK